MTLPTTVNRTERPLPNHALGETLARAEADWTPSYGSGSRRELRGRLMEAVRSSPVEHSLYDRAGKEGLTVLAAERRDLRRAFRVKIVLADVTPFACRSLTGEDHVLELETAQRFELARERGEQGLRRPQRRWFAALKASAANGAFFEASGRPNFAAASRLLDKHRSSAQRAFRELERHFGRELEKLR